MLTANDYTETLEPEVEQVLDSYLQKHGHETKYVVLKETWDEEADPPHRHVLKVRLIQSSP